MHFITNGFQNAFLGPTRPIQGNVPLYNLLHLRKLNSLQETVQHFYHLDPEFCFLSFLFIT